MVFSILFSAIILFTGAFGILNFLHMFQLNSYKPKEQIKWYLKNPYRILPCIVILTLGLISAFLVYMLDNIAIVIAIIFLVISLFFGLFLKPQKAKKPLVYTARVKRLLATYVVVYGLIILSVFLFGGMWTKLLITAIASGGIPLILLFCNLINKPIELSINRHYINDAKRILKSNKNLNIIGVTGSFGKTSVKFYLNTLLRAKYNVLATPESYNTPLGIVRTVREKLKATHQIFICEMGARNVGDIKEICDIVHPNHGVITSIGEQHLETFKTLDNITNTKFELADSLSDNGMLFVNGD
ncbi:MAG: UDP-N-acetylmuramoyl-tripeptide--D-alanyl-D-alanine ligase, partial [Clostridiales bacterium]|nr:UDP-N-acetylmuramoyl-tripeptide--D-alanyl-D-alanine ligase [Clostridiales bacterium]